MRRAARRPGSCTTPARSSAPPRIIGWTMTGPPMRSAASRTACSSPRSSATPPTSVLCAPAAAVLTTTGKPSSRAAATASSGVCGATFRDERQAVREQELARRARDRATPRPRSRAHRARRAPPLRGRCPRAPGRFRTGRRSQSARSAARPSARAADSGYAKAAMRASGRRSGPGIPAADMTTASTGFGSVADRAARSSSSATCSAVAVTVGTKSTTIASICGSSSSAGSASA